MVFGAGQVILKAQRQTLQALLASRLTARSFSYCSERGLEIPARAPWARFACSAAIKCTLTSGCRRVVTGLRTPSADGQASLSLPAIPGDRPFKCRVKGRLFPAINGNGQVG
ncbi:hypothetical protein AAFF_G00300890 [Aldrovandia affinis]|uniref:Uncharacterized protein n=1 Tax=Aldrovandia affinis TaxID=143900 RepID=A0AAD7WRN2_9TELE|nr:hypothetical protein AAFF_G00300890 [Aldrovandia affinis]